MEQTAVELTRIGHWSLGIIIPAIIFGVSFALAWGLFKHFTKKLDEGEAGVVE